MKKLKGSLAAKWTAAILLAVSAVAAGFTGVAGIYMADAGAYGAGASIEELMSDEVSAWGLSRSASVADMLSYMVIDSEEGAGAKRYERMNESYPGFCFDILDENGETVFDGLKGREAMWTGGGYGVPVTVQYVVQKQIEPAAEPSETPETAEPDEPTETAGPDEALDGQSSTPQPTDAPEAQTPRTEEPDRSGEESAWYGTATYMAEEEKEYRIVGHVLKDIPEDSELYQKMNLLRMMYTYRTEILYAAAASLIASIALFLFLMAAAGHRNGVEGIKTGFTERIPFDLFTLAIFCAEAIVLNVTFETAIYGGNRGISIPLEVVLCAAGGAAFVLICLWWCMSFAVRIKLRTVLKSCLCYRVIAWCWRLVKKCWGFIKETAKGLPLLGQAAWIIAGILLVEFIYIGICGSGAGLFFGWFVERAALVLLTVYTLLCMKRLLTAGKEIAAGNLTYTVDTAHMYGPFKEHAESLNNITVGLNRAVGERMKSERFRTELITNVSHDIKTPLTSIINYVDLMEKEEPESEKMREYLEVLSRQSARLKKLIEDLMEASKASSGALNVNLEHCELGVLIDQCAGEYTEKLAAKGLALIVDKPESPVSVMADGRHMWRIFDNLLNNICKYAQNGTRVYIDLERQGDRAVVTFRNISASRLNISGDELIERFVRGDLSRNTEGSGLGLSIAQSLTKLQKGEMTLTVDGDLFKVELSFTAEKQ